MRLLLRHSQLLLLAVKAGSVLPTHPLLPAAAVAVAGGADLTRPTLNLPIQAGSDGYVYFRIPLLVALGSDRRTLLLFTEGRRLSSAYHGAVDVVLKRSTDGGATWGALRKVYGESTAHLNVTIGNPSPIVDEKHPEHLVLTCCRNNKQVLVLHSANAGVDWSAPADISTQVVKTDWSWVTTGPSAGIRLPSGRVIVCADHVRGSNVTTGPIEHSMWTDDSGTTWQASPSLPVGQPHDLAGVAVVARPGNECTLALAPHGSALMNMRTVRPEGRRQFASSSDDGETWTKPTLSPFPFVGQSNVCGDSMVQLPNSGPVVWSSPYDGDGRVNMSLFVSDAFGSSFEELMQVTVGHDGYSALAAINSSAVALAFEVPCATNAFKGSLRFTTIDLGLRLKTEDAPDADVHILPPSSPVKLPTLVRGWSSGLSQGPWCGEDCLVSSAAKLLEHNMSLEVDPFMQITESVWPTVIGTGWWVPGGLDVVKIDANGRPAPDPGRFPSSAKGRGLGALCNTLHGLRGDNNAGGLRCGAELVLGVPRVAVTAGIQVLGEENVTVASVANHSDPLGPHFFGLNSSAPGAEAYARSLAQGMVHANVDHIQIVSGAWAERWLPTVRAFAVEWNRTLQNKRTLAIGGGLDDWCATPVQEYALPSGLRRLADSVAAGPPIWDTWSHLSATLSQAKKEWRAVASLDCGEELCARLDIGVLPIGRIGAVHANQSYPPWHPGSCTPAQLGCGDASAAPACCPRQSRLSEAEARFAYALALAADSPLVLGGSLLGLSNSLPSMHRFVLPDTGAFAYSRNPQTSHAAVLPRTGSNNTIVYRGSSSTEQPRMFDYEWMCFIFNLGDTPLSLSLDLASLPLDHTAPGNATGRDYMLYSLLGAGGPDGAYFGGRALQIGGGGGNRLVGHDAWALRVQRVRVGPVPR